MREFKALTLLKGEHRYAFFFDPASAGSVRETLLVLGRFASNKALDFTWFDAAYLSNEVRRLRYMALDGVSP